MVYLKYLIGLISGLFLILLASSIWRSRYSKEGWEDVSNTDPDSKDDEIKKQVAKLQTEYSKYQKWLTSFCKTWNEVAQKAQQAAQYNGSQDEYIQTLEAKSGIQLYRCSPEWGEKPDPVFISQNLPEDTTLFKNTIAFMKSQTDNIKANTQAAMDGQISGFQDFSPNCTLGTDALTCIFPLGPGGSILPVNLTPEVLANKLEKMNNSLIELNKPLQEVQANLADLNKTANKAESGQLFKEIKLPDSLPG
jgi:hypothetical protein